MSMITRFRLPSAYQLAAPPARLVSPDTTAASRSALGRSLIADIAMSRPSEETAMASTTPAVLEVKESRSQLKVFAVIPRVGAEFRAARVQRRTRTARRARGPRPDPRGWPGSPGDRLAPARQ